MSGPLTLNAAPSDSGSPSPWSRSNAIEMMFFIPAYPFWALVIIAADVVALWGLCAYGSRENLEAV